MEISGVEVANLESGNLTGVSDQQGGNEAVDQGAQQQAQQVAQQQVAEQYYDVKINGQIHKVPLNELTAGYSRQRDYTEKTMRLSQERDQYNQRISQYEDQLNKVNQFLSDPRVQNALRQVQSGITDPSQPLTGEQLLQMQQQEAQRQQMMIDQRMEQVQNELKIQQLASQYTGEIDTTISTLLAKHPVLQDIDGIEQLLKRDVQQREPTNLQEAKQAFAEVAQLRADRIMSRFQQQQKEVAVQQGKLVKNGIEVGGASPAIAQQARKDKLGSNDFFNSVVEELMQSSVNR